MKRCSLLLTITMPCGVFLGSILAMPGVPSGKVLAQTTPMAPIDRLLKTNQCPNCDLRGVNLENANLFGANLVGANLQGANLNGVNLGSANLTDANLQGAKLNQSYLHQAVLENAIFTNADLTAAYLRDALLMGATFQGANLEGINLSRTNLAGLNFQGANLNRANLSSANLIRIRFPGGSPRSEMLTEVFYGFAATSFMGNSCEGLESSFPKNSGIRLLKTDLSQAQLKGANLQGTILAFANFSRADLTDANLTEASLNCANLTNAILDGADLNNTQTQGTIAQGVSMKGTKNNQDFMTQMQPSNAPASRDARYTVGTMNRAQQAHYLEFNRFGAKLKDLQIGRKEESETYSYRVFAYADRKGAVMNAAVPKREGLPTYLGFISLQNDGAETTTRAILCESTEAKAILPPLPRPLPKGAITKCPNGFRNL
ncbi:MAG: pentapeptide repeat-containing protein [Synechococcales bacterium]|nr:pentapeptide repeat-containing protein [Synechococcales bacterium]